MNLFKMLFAYILLVFLLSCNNKSKTKGYIKTNLEYIYKTDYSNYTYFSSEEDIIISSSDFPLSLNPYQTQVSIETFFQKALFSTVFDIDPKDGSITKNLIQDYYISKDKLKYIFKLKNNIIFNDGNKVTADDLNASL